MFGVAHAHTQYKILLELEKLYFRIILYKIRLDSTRRTFPFIILFLVMPRFRCNCLYVQHVEKCRMMV